MEMRSKECILSVEDLHVEYKSERAMAQALNGVLYFMQGRIFGRGR